MDKLLSIIVPSYNMEQYLPKCCDSLLIDDKELFDKLDVIIVNDGSKDRTSKIAHSYEAKYPGVFRVIDKPNGHYGSCINAALKVAVGEFVRILDADDYVRTAGLSALLEELETTFADVVICDMVRVNENGETVYKYPPKELPESFDFPSERLGDLPFLMLHVITYRRRIFDGGWYYQMEGVPYTDCIWSSVPMLKVKTVRYVPEVVTCYLVGRGGQSIDCDVRARNFDKQGIVDIALAKIHAQGKPEYATKGVWAYFTNLFFNEIKVFYSGCIFGFSGHYPKDGVLQQFDSDFKVADPLGYVEAEEKVFFPYAGNRCKFEIVKAYHAPRLSFVLQLKTYLAYIKVKKGIDCLARRK